MVAAGSAGTLLSPESYRGRRIPQWWPKVMPEDSSTWLGMTLLALSTFPDAEAARGISNQLVAEKLVACANILPSVESIYHWKDKIESGNETLVFFKLSEDGRSAFQEKLRSLHPYEVPEIIFVPISSGLPEYLRWVADNCG